MHRDQPALVGKLAEQGGRALGSKAQQTGAQRQAEAFPRHMVAVDGEPVEREVGSELRQIAARLGFIKGFVRFRRGVERVTHQQRLFGFGK